MFKNSRVRWLIFISIASTYWTFLNLKWDASSKTTLLRSIGIAGLAHRKFLNHMARVLITPINKFRVFPAEMKRFWFQRKTSWTHESVVSILAPHDSKTVCERIFLKIRGNAKNGWVFLVDFQKLLSFQDSPPISVRNCLAPPCFRNNKGYQKSNECVSWVTQ